MWKCSDICAVLCVVTVFKYVFVWTFATHTVCTFPHMYMWYRYMCSSVLCVVNESGHLPYTLCLHTLHIVCCKCLCNLFRHISVRGHLSHSLISIYADFEYFFWKKSIFEIQCLNLVVVDMWFWKVLCKEGGKASYEYSIILIHKFKIHSWDISLYQHI